MLRAGATMKDSLFGDIVTLWVMDSRLLRYFVAVAEELNFGRAAERLHMAAPPLSRAIRQLEAELGVTLFERSTRHVELTSAGSVLLAEARIALDALTAAVARTRRAAIRNPTLVLAVKADGDAGLLDEILATYAADPDALPVTVRLCGRGEHAGLLRAGEVDAALVHEPFDHTGIDAEVIAHEPRVAVLPAVHPLAARDQVRLGDLGLSAEQLEPYVDDIAARFAVRDLPQLLAHVELGSFFSVLPASVVDRYPRPGVVYRPVSDAPPAALTIAWPHQSRSPATAAIVRVASELGLRSPAAVAAPPGAHPDVAELVVSRYQNARMPAAQGLCR